ncbi:MAG: type I-MYXAN CRISPR-associated protein Cas6/Cmx6 [Gammaproteobacteria bacterium]|jgi:CRISPR-associated protein Cas6|nr:type I-MYXAN CRISPR-associated protein Cas6/Cmx6 [Gammaproteobacteria bacterium]MBT3725132.1 type I-MYXAN CRISPR-associated protein Cas6/Cmx6 [Gammaproteobacteria bacterium]MBT4078523.1 type I-MYXAN CRISPR-associated protein Cas6/Cmx6 [Gammaproteobacteria bacterium]MBT4193282.1 type I-MYXAN CRISPR-associated protein Cas6/Cmx6 [Gammaproteobacteria bacterium]MBT4862127.1 type I-MYXAN CRISPR-associated protein Cas6/Cmx6 [Gammaproteobacteria bacterium]
MYWQEDEEKGEKYQVPEDVLDLLFKIECKSLPLDHGFALSEQIIQQLPWIKEEARVGIHQIHVAESANGWMRPDDPETEVLNVSRRTKMTIRVPTTRLEDIKALTGKTLDINGHSLKVGTYSTRKLSKLTTIFARYMDTDGTEDENKFLEGMVQKLLEKDIKVKKMLSGKLMTHKTDQGTILTRKIMISDLDVMQSVLLQEQGLGDKQLLGMGIFIPHKGIDAVNKEQEKS